MKNAALLLVLGPMLATASRGQAPGEWPAYGRDAGGSRHSPLRRITRENVSRLTTAWTYRTGETGPAPRRGSPPALETTPIMVDGTLYVSTPMGRVIALDPATGRERWRFDPGVNRDGEYGDFAQRGVSTWLDTSAAPNVPCRRRILIGTIDARLIALDAKTGARCEQFGQRGAIDLRVGLRIAPAYYGAYEQTSPPAVINNIIVVGSAIADNFRTDPASGEVRGFDARTGVLRWTWHPIPQVASDAAFTTWEAGSPERTGGANVWTAITADPELDLAFLATSSAAPDYFGGLRKGENRYANSVVALQASTGRVVWHFQTVHHDLWDFDNASPPALTTISQNGRAVPAVLQATKTGMLFVLHRETGAPLYRVEERAVPASDVPGEVASPTQPFTAITPPLVPHRITEADLWGANDGDLAACKTAFAGLRNDGAFTPPSLGGSLVIPSNVGGAHWGGVATDADRGLAVLPVNNIAAVVQLIPQDGFNRARYTAESPRYDWQFTPMTGTPFVMRRRLFLSPSRLPCTRPPFGSLIAVNLNNGSIKWSVPLGHAPQAGTATASGTVNLGGPIVTASGLIFIGATLDRGFRAFDIDTGRELWHATLPAGARATPMTYEWEGRQYVVIAAGGGGAFGDGDSIIAFALPQR